MCLHLHCSNGVFLQLNAFDHRHLDDINFDVRFAAFQTIASHIKDMQAVDANYLIPVMHNCFYNMEVGVCKQHVLIFCCHGNTATII